MMALSKFIFYFAEKIRNYFVVNKDPITRKSWKLIDPVENIPDYDFSTAWAWGSFGGTACGTFINCTAGRK